MNSTAPGEISIEKQKWEQARAAMLLDTTMINLNTGSFGPLPRCVFEKATALRKRLAEEPMAFLVRESPPLLWQAREALAHLLGTDPQQLIFQSNVSEAINTVASSLPLPTQGEILLTDHEYGAMHWCWERAAQRQGLTLRTFPLPVMADNPEEIVSAFANAMSPRTRMLFFSHVLSPTGLVLPAERICQIARARGIITVIDGAHAPAMIPLDLKQIDADFYAGNCHKWLLGPTGSGFLQVRPGNENLLRPLQVSWGFRVPRGKGQERNAFGATHWIYQFEFAGTRDPCPWLAIPTAIAFQEGLSWSAIRVRNEMLFQKSRKLLGEKVGLRFWTPDHPELHGFLSTFLLPEEVDPDLLKTLLWQKYRIEVPTIPKPYGNLLRVSTHFYDTVEELECLAEILPKAMNESKRR